MRNIAATGEKYFLIVSIGFFAACAQPHDVNPIQDIPSAAGTPSVVNGKIVSLKKDSFAKTIVSLQSKVSDGTANCTGTIIAPRAILTAAHCLTDAKSVTVKYAVDSQTSIPVAEWKVHPAYKPLKNFRPENLTPDFALIRLEKDIPSGARAARLASPADGLALDQTVISYGYGFSDAGTDDFLGIFEWDYKDTNKLLNAGTFTVVSSKDAGTRLKTSKLGTEGKVFLTYKAKSAICQGDSGGPTFLTGTEAPIIVGVNSFITDARCIEALNGLADVRFNRQWIDATLAAWFPTTVSSSGAHAPATKP